jgi:hypothetical protein
VPGAPVEEASGGFLTDSLEQPAVATGVLSKNSIEAQASRSGAANTRICRARASSGTSVIGFLGQCVIHSMRRADELEIEWVTDHQPWHGLFRDVEKSGGCAVMIVTLRAGAFCASV